MLLDSLGVGAFPWSLVVLLVAAFLIAWLCRSHAFQPGLRSGGVAVVGH
jgi:hypothetical protein